MSDTPSLMRRETDQSSAVIARLLERARPVFDALSQRYADAPPPFVTTAARGSSDHAATYFKYLFEIVVGRPVASIGPSIASVYGAPLFLQNGLHLTVSQSGASPDIVALQQAARAGGALTLAIVNVADSPLARQADLVLDIDAGAEESVAATKSFMASTAALAGIVAAIARNAPLQAGLEALPGALGRIEDHALAPVVDRLVDATSLYLTGRGPGFAVALEAALKSKETAALHAEAFSAAELMHGPLQLVEPGFPVIGFVSDDAAYTHSLTAFERLANLDAHAMVLSSRPVPARTLVDMPTTGSGLVDPLVCLLAYYRIIEQVSRRRGLDPDRPRHLKKITETT